MYNAAVILLRTHERMDKAILGVGLHCDGDSGKFRQWIYNIMG